MLTTIEKILFGLLAAGSLYYGGSRLCDVYRAIARGKPDMRFDHLADRIRRALWIVLVGSSRVDLQACKLEYSIVSPK